jgi:hypothetical protein
MEATGVYWMSLYDMLEAHGLKVCLVHPREVQQVKGRKTDVKDSQWIQKLYAAGILRESIVAEGLLKELRMLVRERGDLIEMGGTYVNKMQKYLELMNIKLRNVISQIHGESGLKVIRAILSGERNADKLLQLCHISIREKKSEEMKKALQGNYSKRYLLLLKENLRLWEEHQQSIRNIETQIEELLEEMGKSKQEIAVENSPSCPARHHNPQIKDLHTKLVAVRWCKSLQYCRNKRQYDASPVGRNRFGYESFSHGQTFCQLVGIKSQEQTERKDEAACKVRQRQSGRRNLPAVGTVSFYQQAQCHRRLHPSFERKERRSGCHKSRCKKNSDCCL